MCCVFLFFFCKQKTAYDMRISDWSSDVCSSDLEFFRATKARTSEHACRNWNAHYAGKEAFTCLSPSGYRQGAILNNSLQAHRVIWAIVFGESPVAQIDHINGDRSDNRLKNLRAVSIQQNRRNMRRPRRNTSGCLGVSRNPGSSTWRARDRKST